MKGNNFFRNPIIHYKLMLHWHSWNFLISDLEIREFFVGRGITHDLPMAEILHVSWNSHGTLSGWEWLELCLSPRFRRWELWREVLNSFLSEEIWFPGIDPTRWLPKSRCWRWCLDARKLKVKFWLRAEKLNYTSNSVGWTLKSCKSFFHSKLLLKELLRKYLHHYINHLLKNEVLIA